MNNNEWILVKERLPDRVPNKSYSQVQCLVNKRYEWERGENSGVFYQIQILTFNHEHECWDGEDGDDHDCAIDQVTHWMPLPEPPPKP
jgi:membrane-bound lytic murein transglycosylase MltF